MQVKTISTAAGVNEIDFGNDNSQSTAHFYWLKNLGASTLYVSANPNPIAEKDDVAELPAKGAVSVETDEGKIYVLGAGKVEIHRTNSKFCPFDWQSSGSGGGGGGSITVDSELSDTSTNPLQNKVTTAAINEVKSDLAKTQEDVAENAAALSAKSDINHTHDMTASGNPVIFTNLQGEVPFSEIVVSGKNLLNYRISALPPGITVTTLGDGSLKVSGKMERESAWGINLIAKNPLSKGKTYTLSVNPDIIGILPINIYYIGAATENNTFVWDRDDDFTISLNIQPNVDYDFVFRPQLELGETATNYEPPIMGRELQVNASGKNLLPAMSNSVTRNGVTYTVNANGTITLNGTAEKADGVDVITKTPLKAGVYTLSGCPEGGSGTSFALRAGLGTTNTLYGRDYGNGLKITAETDTVITVTIQNAEIGRVFDNFVFRPQLELGDTATEYEPYHGSVTTITPTSNPYTIPDSIGQQDGYNVVGVSEGKLSVVGVQKNAAIERIWDEIGDVKTILATVTGGIE